jgi:hypothetical protein
MDFQRHKAHDLPIDLSRFPLPKGRLPLHRSIFSRRPEAGRARARCSMAIEDNFSTMTDSEMKTLAANVERLSTTGSDRQRLEAARLQPLIAAELAARIAAKPAPKTPVRKKAVPKAAKKTAAPAETV